MIPLDISVVIPTYNRKELLIETIQSVLAQSLQPKEILIINNGSDAVMLPENVMALVKVVEIVTKAGPSQARNFGAIIAKSPVLAFLDDDDTWCNDYLKLMSEKLLSENLELCLGVLYTGDESQNKLLKDPSVGLNLNNLFLRNPGVTGSNIVINRDVFLRVGGFDVNLITGEDKSLILDSIIKEIKIGVQKEAKVFYRLHNQDHQSNDANMAIGIQSFLRKYENKMPRSIRFKNKCKVYKYKFKVSKNPAHGCLFLCYKTLSLLIR